MTGMRVWIFGDQLVRLAVMITQVRNHSLVLRVLPAHPEARENKRETILFISSE